MPRRRTEADVLRISLAATGRLAQTGGAASAAELAEAAEVSVRTFHRLFPRKEDCIRPALADARRLFVRLFASAAGPAADAAVLAFAATAGGAFLDRTRLLIPLIDRNAQFAAVWDHALAAGRDELAAALLSRADERDPLAAHTHAAVLITLMRLALADAVSGEDPATALRTRMRHAARFGIDIDVAETAAIIPENTP